MDLAKIKLSTDKLKELGREYGLVFVEMDNDEIEKTGMGSDYFVNRSFIVTNIVRIGIYDDQEKCNISIFHEIGHYLSEQVCINGFSVDDSYWKIRPEALAWFIGLQEAYRHGYTFSQDTLVWAVDQLMFYRDYK